MDDCIFCKIVKREIPSEIIFEDDLTLAFMDAFPVSEGHLLIIPKNHYEKFHDLPEEVISVILNNLKTIALAARVSNYNLLQNNGKVAGQSVFHAHFHLIPRDTERVGFTYSFGALEGVDQKSVADRIRTNL
ncbi:MAG: HIT family protein [Candidatus Kariarchaeaceae archaeon]|jgi:diadenosine tetraphosphate (Ap4A) HIT family hydrolase